MPAFAQGEKGLFANRPDQSQSGCPQSQPLAFDPLSFRVVVAGTKMLAEILPRVFQVILNLRLDHRPNARVNRANLRNEVSFRFDETPYPLREAQRRDFRKCA